MRLHTDTLTIEDVCKAATVARAWFDMDDDPSYWGPTRPTEHRSRKRARAFEVKLRGESARYPNGGRNGSDDHTATWDQWGVFLAALFELDPRMTCWAYDGAASFHAKTADRFRDGWPADAHGDHRFEYDGTPGEQRCRKCSAVTRWKLPASVTA